MCDMKTAKQTRKIKRGTGAWYTERGTYTEPYSFDSSLEWICRAGKRISLVKKEN
jgi:hypothetical protein